MANQLEPNQLSSHPQQQLYNSLISDYPDLANSLSSSQLFDVVNLIWSQRDKILGAADLLWDNRDEIVDAVEYVMNQRERIADFLEKVPEFLGKTAHFIHEAGESAVQASAYLTGEGGKKDSTSVRDLAELAAGALERCNEELRATAQLLENLGRQIDDVKIPMLKPEYSQIMGFNVVTGVELGESNLVDDAAEQLKRGSLRLNEIGDDFRNVAQNMRKLGGVITDAGQDLSHVGSKLQESSAMLTTLTQLPQIKADAKQPAKKLNLKSSTVPASPKQSKAAKGASQESRPKLKKLSSLKTKK